MNNCYKNKCKKTSIKPGKCYKNKFFTKKI